METEDLATGSLGLGSATAPKAALSDIDHALNELDQFEQKLCDRLATRKVLRLSERYIKFDFYLLHRVRMPSVEFYIIHKRDDRLGVGGDAGERARLPDAENAVLEREGHDRRHDDVWGTRCYRDNLDVFVHGVDLMQEPEVAVPALVWLQPAHKPLCLNGRAIEFPHNGFFKPFWRGADRKAGLRPRLSAVVSNQLTDHLIEGGAEIVSYVANDDADLAWRAFVDTQAVDFLAGLRVDIGLDGVGVATEKVDDQFVEFGEVSFGPIEL